MTGADVAIAGAGPAGSIAALVLARAGARVRVLDRAEFPRDKLCGDTLNPGAMELLRRLDLAAAVEARGLPVEGMRVTGPGGVGVRGVYGDGIVGRALRRRDLDQQLLEAAVRAGAEFHGGLTIAGPIVEGGRVRGLRARDRHGTGRSVRAAITIAADGRRSALAFALGLAFQPRRPRRWAVGRYFEGVAGLGPYGEMHVRRGHYLGVAPLPDGLANACLVLPALDRRAPLADPEAALAAAIAADPELSDRFAGARPAGRAVVVGPLAVDLRGAGVPGLLLAGDAAGFVDPMTGDGLRIAMHGAELAAAAALADLGSGRDDGHERLAAARRAAFGAKWRVNRALRALVASPGAVSLATAVVGVLPGLLPPLVRFAGDVGASGRGGA